MVDVMIWDPFERFLTVVGITLLFIAGIFYIYKGKKRKDFNERIMMIGFGCYFIGLVFQRLFGGYLGHFFIPGSFTDFVYIGDLETPGELFKLLFKIDYVLWAIGAALFILAFEMGIKKTKYILTFIQIPLIVLIIILPYDPARNIQRYFLYPFSTSIIIASTILLAKWSRFELKAISSLLFFGIVFLMMSSGLVSKDVKMLNIRPMLYLSPIFYIIGALVVIIPLLIDPVYFSHVLGFWIMCGIITIGTLLFVETYFILHGVSIPNVILYTFLLSVVIFLVYRIIKDIQYSKAEKGYQIDGPILLEMFTRPEKLTEDEVSISKEKKICLVCKGKISGINFTCTECEILYCLNCYESLSNLENVCWGCDTPLDASQPSEPYNFEKEMDVKKKIAKNEKEELTGKTPKPGV